MPFGFETQLIDWKGEGRGHHCPSAPPVVDGPSFSAPDGLQFPCFRDAHRYTNGCYQPASKVVRARNWQVEDLPHHCRSMIYRPCGDLQAMRGFTGHAGIYRPCGDLQAMRGFTGHAGIYRPCGDLQAMRGFTGHAGIYRPCGDLQAMRGFTGHAGDLQPCGPGLPRLRPAHDFRHGPLRYHEGIRWSPPK